MEEGQALTFLLEEAWGHRNFWILTWESRLYPPPTLYRTRVTHHPFSHPLRSIGPSRGPCERKGKQRTARVG